MDKKSGGPKTEKITSSSTKEETAAFFLTKFKISKELQDKMIKEDISGDILLNIEEDELKKIGFKIGPIKKVKKYLSENKADFPEKKLDEEIDDLSTVEDVKTFFENYIGFKGDIGIDGKQLLELKKEDMLKMGLNLGQIKKLEKYIKHFREAQSKKKEKEKEKVINKDDNKPPENVEDNSKKDNDLNENNIPKDREDSKEKQENEKPEMASENKDKKNSEEQQPENK